MTATWEERMKTASKIGDAVRVRDESGVEHNALVTAVHGPECINAVYASGDAEKSDPYGRQIERMSSLQKRSEHTAANGRYYETV